MVSKEVPVIWPSVNPSALISAVPLRELPDDTTTLAADSRLAVVAKADVPVLSRTPATPIEAVDVSDDNPARSSVGSAEREEDPVRTPCEDLPTTPDTVTTEELLRVLEPSLDLVPKLLSEERLPRSPSPVETQLPRIDSVVVEIKEELPVLSRPALVARLLEAVRELLPVTTLTPLRVRAVEPANPAAPVIELPATEGRDPIEDDPMDLDPSIKQRP